MSLFYASLGLPGKVSEVEVQYKLKRFENVRCMLNNDYKECVKAVSISKNTLLHIASMEGDVVFAEFLLKRGAVDVIDLKDNCGETPLVLAIRFNHEKMIKLLLEYGASTNIDVHGECGYAIYELSRMYCSKEISLLIKKHTTMNSLLKK